MIELNINPKDFDQQVFQTNTEFTQEQYNTWLHNITSLVQTVRDWLDEGANSPCPVDTTEINQLGDLANLLSTITITTEPRGETWTVTPADIDGRYDISHLSDEEVRTLVDRCAHCCQNDGMADYYWEAIRYICEEEMHLTKKEDEEDPTPPDYQEKFNLNANTLYVHLRSQHKDDDYDYLNEFLNTKITGYEHQTIQLNDIEQRIVNAMTNHEHVMDLDDIHWNDDDITDYESAMEALCELIESYPNCLFKWDEHSMPQLIRK